MKRFTVMRVVLIAIAAYLAAVGATRAEDKPAESFLKEIYKPYEKSSAGIDLHGEGKAARYFTQSLARLIDQDAADSAKSGAVGRLSFDPFIAGRDWQPTKIKLEVGPGEKPGEAVGVATFTAQGENEPSVVKLDLVRTPDGWRIADIHWKGQDDSLAEILSSKE
jgi:hypothetical protein